MSSAFEEINHDVHFTSFGVHGRISACRGETKFRNARAIVRAVEYFVVAYKCTILLDCSFGVTTSNERLKKKNAHMS
jgi:hypothetical protein